VAGGARVPPVAGGGLVLLVGAQLASVGARGYHEPSLSVNMVLLSIAALILTGELCPLFQREAKADYSSQRLIASGSSMGADRVIT
jgi:hypothetical protein